MLLHIYDGYGSERARQFCTDDCSRGPIDTLSSSLISRRPLPREAGAVGRAGFILAPDVEVFRGANFYHDAFSGGHPNGKCPWPPRWRPHTELPHTGRPLGEVMVEHFDACAGGESGERYHGTGHFVRNVVVRQRIQRGDDELGVVGVEPAVGDRGVRVRDRRRARRPL